MSCRSTAPSTAGSARFPTRKIVYPERFTIALLSDGRQIAQAQGHEFTVLTYHDVALKNRTATIRRAGQSEIVREFEPSAIVNATGAWVDHTLGSLGVESKRLMGGTKGSHFVTSHARLQALLAGRAIYTEAGDGRPIFILPFVHGTLIGTTDEPYEGDPANAVATPRELEYLVTAVNDVFPDLRLTAGDIDMHYAGVRPLPYSDASHAGRHFAAALAGTEPDERCAAVLDHRRQIDYLPLAGRGGGRHDSDALGP